ncbi:hypothetical protein KVR01_012299 [Diaporthe batatas]|uniref:uncharacterized protein n=1 Tax=Diaporthe batatas TaxID=748121 RepID=UPI001D057E8A|nr:uncharacterized protein KVR01_012299 [Diaporthe batatas]KAG8158027.1 hypothetical protein KVR01_012299 [Diaporthe batatas]
MSEASIPILATGRTEAVGSMVVALMQPEYEVIHMTLASSIKDELPFLLKGQAPPNPSTTLGTGNWSSPPQALLIGGAYQDKDIEEIVRLVEGINGALEIPWLRLDVTKTEGPGPPPNPTPEQAAVYGKIVVQRMKDGLSNLKKEGKLGPGNGGIHLV